MYAIRVDDKAMRFLERAEKHVARRIWYKLLACVRDPYQYFERLEGRSDYKLRVGEYRVIADISKESIEITYIGHRKNVYQQHL